jgi:hypothetical protein
MAFGALGRARAAPPATTDTASKDDAKPADKSESQAFAASEADNQTNSADIPEPATYDKAETSSVPAADATSTKSHGVSAAKAPLAPAPAEPTELKQLNPLVVAGVPLAAAALLMGVYWLILRAGAV